MKLIFCVLTFFVILTGCNLNSNYNSEEHELNVIRKGAVIKVKPEKFDFYKRLHANPSPGVNEKLKECNIRNYSIYYREGFLFSYMEYTGKNWEEDMKKLAADSTIQEWWKLTDPCQEPVSFAKDNEWWADLEEIYHLD